MAIPRPTDNLYPSVEWYYIVGITDDDKLCVDGVDNADGFTNILCEPDYTSFADGTIICSTLTCDATDCGSLDPTQCTEPVSFYSAIDTLVATCLINEGSTECEAMTSTDIARPDGSAQTEGTTRWYVGDDSYVIGTDYTCGTSDDISDYINALCSSDGSTLDSEIHVFCKKAEAEPVEGMLGDPKLTASNCSITSCTDMPIGMCDTPVDLYILDSDAVTYSDTCVKGDGSGTNCSSTTGTTPDPDESSESDDSSSSSDSSESSAKTATAVTFVTAIVAMFAL